MKHLIFFYIFCSVISLPSKGQMKEYYEQIDSSSINKIAPDFSITTLEGEEINLAALLEEDKILVLNFWFPACSPCIREFPLLNQLVADYQENDKVVFLAISIMESGVKSIAYHKRLHYPIAIDESREIADMYGIKMYPTNLIVDNKGKIIFYQTGFFEEENLTEKMSHTINQALDTERQEE